MRCSDCDIQLTPSPKATNQERCEECAKEWSLHRRQLNKKHGIKHRSAGRPTKEGFIPWPDRRRCVNCNGLVPMHNPRLENLCEECWGNPPNEIVFYHEFVWPYYSGEEIELVNVFNQRVEAHRGHLKKWWDSLPNSSCPVCGGA